MIYNKISSLSLIVVVSTASTAFAQTGLGYGGGVAFESFHDAVPGTNEYRIDGQFSFDPIQGGWLKTLNAPAGGWIPSQVYAVHETITLLPDPTGVPTQPLTDWHEHIELGSDGNIWDIWVDGSSMFSIDGSPAPGLMTMLNDAKTDIWFLFDAIEIGPAGIMLDIWKEFQFVGMEPMNTPVRIYEFPTPAPGATALLGLAGLYSTRRRR